MLSTIIFIATTEMGFESTAEGGHGGLLEGIKEEEGNEEGETQEAGPSQYEQGSKTDGKKAAITFVFGYR